MSRVVIIGGGIGGLAAANLLVRSGHDVTICEQAAIPGGRAGLLQAEGFTFDTGPSWYLMPEVFERYYDALGTDVNHELDIIRLDPSYKVYFESGAPLIITGNRADDAALFESIEPGAGANLVRYAEQAKQLYQLALRYFLYTNFNRPRDFLAPGILIRLPRMIRLMLTPLHSYVGRFVKTQRLQQILEYPMVFLGTSPFEAPSLYSLMGALDFDSGVYYPRGGIYTIIRSLTKRAEENGVTLKLKTEVSRILTKNGRATGVELRDGRRLDADIIISNADLHYTETSLLKADARSYPEAYWQKREASCSALLLYLGVKGKLPELQHHNLLFVDSWKDNFDALYHDARIPEKASLYLSRTSATDPGVAPDGCETLFVLVPLPPGIKLTEEQTTSLSAHYIEQIERMTGVELKTRIIYERAFTPQDFGTVYNSWKNSMLGPSHILRQSAFWRTLNRSRKLKNLYYVGAGTTPGIGLPMCLIGAQNLAERIAKEQPQ